MTAEFDYKSGYLARLLGALWQLEVDLQDCCWRLCIDSWLGAEKGLHQFLEWQVDNYKEIDLPTGRSVSHEGSAGYGLLDAPACRECNQGGWNAHPQSCIKQPNSARRKPHLRVTFAILVDNLGKKQCAEDAPNREPKVLPGKGDGASGSPPFPHTPFAVYHAGRSNCVRELPAFWACFVSKWYSAARV